jgi:hypothetical protein
MEIENLIKKHPILKKRIRYIMINGINYAIDNENFTTDKLSEYIKEIITENEYNLDNYNKLLAKNEELEIDLKKSNDIIKELKTENEKLKKKTFISPQEKKVPTVRTETPNGYSMFAIEIQNYKYRILFCKTSSLDLNMKAIKCTYPDCQLKLEVKIKSTFLEKTMINLLNKHLTMSAVNYYDGYIENINFIFNIIAKLEDIVLNNDLFNITTLLNGNVIKTENIDPEIPIQRRAKRSIDQIDYSTGKIIATYPSIEEAGRKNNITGSAIGICLRNNTISQGLYIYRYSNVSEHDQMSDQPVIRINCDTGEKINYPNIAAAANPANISPPALRMRILRDVHAKIDEQNYHWIFDKTATHYKS